MVVVAAVSTLFATRQTTRSRRCTLTSPGASGVIAGNLSTKSDRVGECGGICTFGILPTTDRCARASGIRCPNVRALSDSTWLAQSPAAFLPARKLFGFDTLANTGCQTSRARRSPHSDVPSRRLPRTMAGQRAMPSDFCGPRSRRKLRSWCRHSLFCEQLWPDGHSIGVLSSVW